MKLIKEICHDTDVECKQYRIRKAARTVLLNRDNQVAVINAATYGFHQICGGKIETGEDNIEAIMREAKEEAGADIEVLGELGMIIEWKNTLQRQQISYCYISKVLGELAEPQYTDKEKGYGYKLEWHNLNDAVKILETDTPCHYEAKYIVERDLTFLKEFLKTAENFKRLY